MILKYKDNLVFKISVLLLVIVLSLALMFCVTLFLFYDVHFVDETFAVTEFVDNEQYVADINVDATL